MLSLASLAGAGWAWWDRRRQDPWQRLQGRVQQRLARLGVAVQAHDPPRARAHRVREVLGTAGQALAELLDALDRQRYGGAPAGTPQRGWWRAFATAARGLPANRLADQPTTGRR